MAGGRPNVVRVHVRAHAIPLAETWVYGSDTVPEPNLSKARRGAIALSAVTFCALVWGLLLGVPSLVTGWLVARGDEQIHHIHDIGWGTFTVAMLGVGIVAQMSEPERRIAPLQQTLACLAAGGISMGASGALFIPSHIVLGAAMSAPVALILMLHPARFDAIRPGPFRPALALVAAAVAVPLLRFAFEQIQIQRVDRYSPHGVRFHWGTMATLAIAIVLVMLVASLGAPGWRISAWCAGAALAIFGLAAVVFPDYASSVGVRWGAAAIAAGAVFFATAEWERTRSPVGHSRLMPGLEPRLAESEITRTIATEV